MLSPQADPRRRCRLGVCARNIVISMAPVGSGFLRITLFGKKHKEDAAASSVGLSCPKYGSSGAVFFVASVMDVVLCRPMLRCFLAVKASPCTRGRIAHSKYLEDKCMGSSPYIWGRMHLVNQRYSFISVHPRTYGANDLLAAVLGIFFGSSPCVRGRCGGLFFCVNE